jgi:excisionase family DNA binding protein
VADPRLQGQAPSANERWSSADEGAQHRGVVRDTVYRWIGHRALPAHRIGRLWKFRLSEEEVAWHVRGLKMTPPCDTQGPRWEVR